MSTFSASKALDIAKQLTEGELDGWTYTAELNGRFGRVVVRDEKGEFVDYFNLYSNPHEARG